VGISVFYLGLVVLVPLCGLFLTSAGVGWEAFWQAALAPRAVAAYRLSFGAAFFAAAANAVFGLLVAWVMVRYRFPGKRIIDALIDLPFALPTAVAGITLTALYAENGWIGALLAPLGVKIAFTPVGVIVALVFIGLPFVVRTVQPVLQDIDAEVEEAAASLGAGRLQTFRRVILPAIFPAILTGFALAFARGIGEYGSVIFIAGNCPWCPRSRRSSSSSSWSSTITPGPPPSRPSCCWCRSPSSSPSTCCNAGTAPATHRTERCLPRPARAASIPSSPSPPGSGWH